MAYEDDIRAARGFKFHIVEQGLDKLLSEIDGLRIYLNKRGGPEAAAARRAERGEANVVYIDFSISVSETDRWAIISLLHDWWGIPVKAREYNFEGIWEEQWVLVMDESEWREYERQKQFELEKGEFLYGHHDGNWYPSKGEGPFQYRGYSFINWAMCRTAGNGVLNYQDSIVLSAAIQDKRERFKFVSTEAYREGSKEPGFFQNTVAKITAWYICHELTHGVFKVGDEGHSSFPFQSRIEPLEILLYYTEKGRSLIDQNEAYDVGGFYGYFGKEKWPRYEKPIHYP
jgi:hypothetical protein